jgi:DNA-directed RNA polymerase subunit RPC12/RpoP
VIRRQDRDTYRCATCERYIPDADLFVTTNKTSGEQMAMHRSCASLILSAMKPPVEARLRVRAKRERKDHGAEPPQCKDTE